MANPRTVTLYSTKGGSKKIETSAATWGELRPLVGESYDLSNLQPTESVGKTTLVHEDATLPEGDFILFLRPVRTKSGMVGTFTPVRYGADNGEDEEDEDFYDPNEDWEDEEAATEDPHIAAALSNIRLAGRDWSDIGIEVFKAGLAYFREASPIPEPERAFAPEPEVSPEDQRLEELLESLERGF